MSPQMSFPESHTHIKMSQGWLKFDMAWQKYMDTCHLISFVCFRFEAVFYALGLYP